MFTEILLRIPFSVIGRTFSSADLSLAAGKMRQNKLVTGGGLPVSIFSVEISALGSLKRVTYIYGRIFKKK